MTKRLWGAPWCPACREAKKWLDNNNIEYVYADVDDESNFDKVLELNIRGIPVLEEDGKILIHGFSSEKYKQLL